jgi:hypothetical protein
MYLYYICGFIQISFLHRVLSKKNHFHRTNFNIFYKTFIDTQATHVPRILILEREVMMNASMSHHVLDDILACDT